MYSKTDIITSVLKQRNYYNKKINKGAFQNSGPLKSFKRLH